jgi:short-subunit dehydrogenase
MGTQTRPFAIVTGASTGIGFEFAKRCAEGGFDLLVVADEPAIHEAARALATSGASVQPLEADLATREGVEAVAKAADGRLVDALVANAGRGLGHGFLDQEWNDIQRVIDTNVTGTLYLLHRLVPQMRQAGRGRILITGSIAGFLPGAFQAVYNGTKALLDSFAAALRNELKDSGVTVTCLMPGATETSFFERADMLDTKVGTDEKQPAEEVAHIGYDAMMRGDAEVIAGVKNKLQVAMSRFLSSGTLAEQHRKMAAPGTAKS